MKSNSIKVGKETNHEKPTMSFMDTPCKWGYPLIM